MGSANRRNARQASASAARSAVTSVLLGVLAIMIVRDILLRRWGFDQKPPSDVTRRLR